MDNISEKIEKYRQIIKQIVTQHAGGVVPRAEEYWDELIIDDERGHYLVLGVGWLEYKRMQGIYV
jgi:hypothetical protein